jgi:amidase
MRPTLTSLLRCSLVLCALTTAGLAQSAGDSISGNWIGRIEYTNDTRSLRMSLQLNGNAITGQSGPLKIEGTLTNATLSLKVLPPDGRSGPILTGAIENGVLKGEGEDNGLKVRWSARRPLQKPSNPRTLTFTPTEFHRVFSHAIPPAMRLFPGDTVQTKSVDAGGSDETSTRRSLGGNPLTGPFYIEGAMPGDTLVVKLNRVRTNRDWAQSGDSVVSNALAPGYLTNLKRAESFSSRWKLDKEKGVAYLEKPSEGLSKLTIPLQPMMGCIGVAPPGRDVIATRDSGIYGGNMDYNQLREGTTIYLPVFQEGALLLMGDGHAAQGDGELTGDALETSMDFEFTVDVIQEKSFGTPRAENAEYLMAIGIGGSLDQALQRSTTAMARWLEQEYKLNSTEAAVVLGFAVKYDIADLVGTQVSIVAKVPKTALAQLKR